ncbi:MAG: hypothetical protein QME12_06815 [Nanoarchaeota archaeon]|nr:hypothetical protein [Nanoarchaeota archaeon]
MKKKISSKAFEIPWWDDWYNADILKRRQMVEKLPFVAEMMGLCSLPEKKFPKKYKMHTITTSLNGFFEDLAGYMQERQRFNAKTLKCNK